VEKLEQTEFVLKGLIPDTNYFFKVKAYNPSGEGPWSDVLLVTTRPTPPLSAPSGVAVSQVTPSGFRLNWETAADAQGYEVSLGTDWRGRNGTVKSLAANQFPADGLKANTTYYVKVRKVNRGGSGPWTQAKEITTAPKTQTAP
jgi:titin